MAWCVVDGEGQAGKGDVETVGQLDHVIGLGEGVVATEHERDEPRAPPRGDFFTRCVELLARRGAVGQLAVADVSQREVFEVSLGPRRVGLDRIGGQAEVARAAVGALA